MDDGDDAELEGLIGAARRGDAGRVGAILARRATGGGLVRALGWAATGGQAQAVRVLLAAGANPCASGSHAAAPGWHSATALHLAVAPPTEAGGAERGAQSLTADVVDTLLAAGADPLARAVKFQTVATPLDWAIEHGHQGAAGSMLAYLAKPSDATGIERRNHALAWCAFAGHTGAVRSLVEAGADVNARLPHGTTPLFEAIEGAPGRDDDRGAAVVTHLLDCGARLDARRAGGVTPLHAAVGDAIDVAIARTDRTGGYVAPATRIVEILLERGADPRDRTDSGEAATDLCAPHPGAAPLLHLLRRWLDRAE